MYNSERSEKPLIDADLIFEKASIESGMVIADLGVGSSGRYVFPVAELVGTAGLVYAVDILKTNLQTIERRIKVDNVKNVEVVWSDIEVFNATKIENSSLDVAFLINTLYQSYKRPQIIREAARMLKDKGKIVVVEWKKIASPFGPPPEFRVRKDNLITICKKNGLIVDGEFFAGKYHYGLIFMKV